MCDEVLRAGVTQLKRLQKLSGDEVYQELLRFAESVQPGGAKRVARAFPKDVPDESHPMFGLVIALMYGCGTVPKILAFVSVGLGENNPLRVEMRVRIARAVARVKEKDGDLLDQLIAAAMEARSVSLYVRRMAEQAPVGNA